MLLVYVQACYGSWAMVTTPTAMRLTPDDLALLAAIQAFLGTNTRTEALRVALKAYATERGIKIPKKASRK